MNSRAIRGLFFEHATRTWPFLAAALLMHLLYASIWLFDAPDARQYEVEPAAQVMTLFIAAIGLIYSVADGERMTSEIPPRTLLLPVPTLPIVAVKFAWSVLSIGALCLIVHGTYFLITSEPRDPWWAYFIVAIVVFAIVQTVAIATGCLGDWSLGFLFAAFVVVTTFLANAGEELIRNQPPIAVALFAPAVLMGCVLISHGIVHLSRTGRWDPELLWPVRARSRAGATASEPAPFGSALAAQRWFETRRMQRYFWIVFAFSVLALTFIDVIPRAGLQGSITPARRLVLNLINFGWTLPNAFMLAALVTGVVMALQNYRVQIGPMRAFVFLRPMSTSDLARARITGVLRGLCGTLLATAAVVFLIGVAARLLDDVTSSNVLSNESGAFTRAQVSVILAAAGAAWIAYWCVNVCSALVFYAPFLIVIDWLDYVDVIPSEASAYPAGRVLAALIIAGLIAVAMRRGLLPPRRAAVAATAVFLFAAVYWILANLSFGSTLPGEWRVSSVPDLIVLALFMLLPIATTPLTLHWARHR